MAMINLLTAALLSGCGFAGPFGYERVQKSTTYIPRELQETIKLQSWSRADTIERVGVPDAVDDARRAMGYQRCVDSQGKRVALIIIVPVPDSTMNYTVSHCQQLRILFDDKDHARQVDERLGRRPDVTSPPQSGELRCNIEDWVQGSCD